MNKYIKVYDNVFSNTQCQHYIDLIEKGNQFPGGIANDTKGYRVDNDIKISSDINISQDFPEEIDFILDVVKKYATKYKEELNLNIPMKNTELIGGRVYRENEGFYKIHVDSSSLSTNKRVLTALFYLNEVEGGALEFPEQDIKIYPKPGRLVLFPPYYMFPHIAHKSIKGDRYIIRVFITM